MLVEIVGSGFRLPTVAEESVRVFFDGLQSPKVDVATDGRIFAITPKRDVGTVDVEVANVDASGVLIPGESAIAASAFEFVRPEITTEHESELKALARTLIRDLKLQLVPNVSLSTHADYQSPGGVSAHITELARLPGIILIGPELEENRFYSLNEEPDFDVAEDVEGPTEFVTTNVPRTVDVTFAIFGFANRKQEALNLQQLVEWYFNQNKFFSLADGALRENDGNSYEMDLVEDARSVGAANNDNLHGFSARMVIRGFDIDVAPGLGIGGLESQTRAHRSYTDDQGVELDVGGIPEVPENLVVRSVLGGAGRSLPAGDVENLVVRSNNCGRHVQDPPPASPVVRSIRSSTGNQT